MRIITWNLNNRKSNSIAWELIFELKPDLVLLSEVNHIPEDLRGYDSHFEPAMGNKGNFRKFKTSLLCKGKIGPSFDLVAKEDWVTKAIADHPGNYVCRKICLDSGNLYNVISVHMPSWQFPHEKYTEDISDVALPNYPKVFMSELLWAALKTSLSLHDDPWIIGGDFKTSEFIGSTKTQRAANVEAIARLERLGLIETVRHWNNGPVPSWKPIRKNAAMKHQLDHLYVSKDLLPVMSNARMGEKEQVLENGLSDHLPIIADFD